MTRRVVAACVVAGIGLAVATLAVPQQDLFQSVPPWRFNGACSYRVLWETQWPCIEGVTDPPFFDPEIGKGRPAGSPILLVAAVPEYLLQIALCLIASAGLVVRVVRRRPPRQAAEE